jgi:hypothetical protein
VQLPNKLHAEMRVTTWNQPIADGDGVAMQAVLALPATSNGDLAPDLQFGDRVQLLLEPMFANWGELDLDGLWRYKTLDLEDYVFHCFGAHSVAVQTGLAKARTNLDELVRALHARSVAHEQVGA